MKPYTLPFHTPYPFLPVQLLCHRAVRFTSILCPVRCVYALSCSSTCCSPFFSGMVCLFFPRSLFALS